MPSTRLAALALSVAVMALNAPLSLTAGDRLGIRVVPQQFTPAPGNLRVIAAVQPDERNRSLSVEIDSIAYYRSVKSLWTVRTLRVSSH